MHWKSYTECKKWRPKNRESSFVRSLKMNPILMNWKKHFKDKSFRNSNRSVQKLSRINHFRFRVIKRIWERMRFNIYADKQSQLTQCYQIFSIKIESLSQLWINFSITSFEILIKIKRQNLYHSYYVVPGIIFN